MELNPSWTWRSKGSGLPGVGGLPGLRPWLWWPWLWSLPEAGPKKQHWAPVTQSHTAQVLPSRVISTPSLSPTSPLPLWPLDFIP